MTAPHWHVPRTPLLLLLALTSVLSLALASAARAEEDPVNEAREAFKSSATFPWYDAEKDSLTPLALRADPPPKEGFRWLSVLQWAAWVLLGIGLLLLIGLIIYSVRYFRGTGPIAEQTAEQNTVVESEGVEALPFMAQRSQGDLLGEARRLYELGNFSEAIVYLFSYELVQLDKFAVIRLARGKTNRQYLRESVKAPPHKQLLENTMHTFEDVFFGRRVLDRAGFEACWNHVSMFENLAEAVPA
jgi:hypothetical protein